MYKILHYTALPLLCHSPTAHYTVNNPEVPEGYHNLLEALANLKREDH